MLEFRSLIALALLQPSKKSELKNTFLLIADNDIEAIRESEQLSSAKLQ